MEKINEILKKLLPAESVNEVSSAIEEMLSEAKAELESEFNEKLEEAYSELSAEKENDEKIALQGYQEAYAIINDLRNRITLIKEEYDAFMNQEYEEAYRMIQEEKKKNNNQASEIYEEYDNKLNEMKDFIVDKLDVFLHQKGSEIYEQAKRDVINDPRVLEQKVAMDRISEIVSTYVSEDEKMFATSSKLDEASRKIEELKGQIKLMEGRNIKLSLDNTKLNEQVRRNSHVITEERVQERKIRKGPQVSGKGHRFFNEEIIQETVKPNVQSDDQNTLVESLNMDRRTLNLLAGTKKTK